MKKLIDRLSLKAIRRLVVGVIGTTVVLLGLVLSVPLIPGPGFVVVLAGLAILATEFVWAQHLLRKARERVNAAVAAVAGRNGANGSPPTVASGSAAEAPQSNALSESPIAAHVKDAISFPASARLNPKFDAESGPNPGVHRNTSD